jgi:hypothetical protein
MCGKSIERGHDTTVNQILIRVVNWLLGGNLERLAEAMTDDGE